MTKYQSAESFWSRPDLVEAYADDSSALDYELDAVRDAMRRAARSGAVMNAHVLGVGTGRELRGVRDLGPGMHLDAWDISLPMVEACIERLRPTGLTNVSVRHASIIDVPTLTSVRADVVIALSAVLGYAATEVDRRESILALRAMCRPGAGLALVVQQRRGRPDWALYFAATQAFRLMRGRKGSQGNRFSRHGDATITFHHFTRAELHTLLASGSFGEVQLCSLRQWARRLGVRLPTTSPNPLIATATAL